MKMSSATIHPDAFIKVDSPSDIVILEPSNNILQNIRWKTSPAIYRYALTTTAEWKGKGNKYFQDTLFVPAALAWSRGLELDPSSHALRLNRAQAYIKLEWFPAALADAMHVLSTSESLPLSMSTKASYRAASAEYGLGRYSHALDRLETLDEDTNIESLKSRCCQRSREAMMGEYLWAEMFRAGQNSVPRLDVAQYTHPALTVVSISARGGGRGIRAARDIATGDLLVRFFSMYRPSTHL